MYKSENAFITIKYVTVIAEFIVAELVAIQILTYLSHLAPKVTIFLALKTNDKLSPDYGGCIIKVIALEYVTLVLKQFLLHNNEYTI